MDYYSVHESISFQYANARFAFSANNVGERHESCHLVCVKDVGGGEDKNECKCDRQRNAFFTHHCDILPRCAFCVFTTTHSFRVIFRLHTYVRT
mmetsp:Transcript_6766/g.10214  ORF Transcript_6766/g.10214 Transcript_6766/m.10214 type:complete len:94 (-) Transcript_6766:98-379(-)